MTTSEAFGDILRKYRKKKGFSQEQLAFRSNLNRTFIARLETAKRQPTLTTLVQLARALEISAASMVAEVEQKVTDEEAH